ncbi:BglII/BstYI family type II restriction endonuclease [Piscibacillus sp. B03]|uniref:BglII/BstYI family type II restriction endonuclease n=1 Tax=Piscibacillus sp. B03 TaxID=3457430 RepID=UPI003FCCEDE1
MNGYEHIMVHKPHIWEEIEKVVSSIDASKFKTKKSREKTKKGNLLYSPVELNKDFKEKLEDENWKESRTQYYVPTDIELMRKTVFLEEPSEQKKIIELNGDKALYSYNQTDFVKERVAIEVQFGKYSFVAYDLFVKHMAFYVANQIDVGIEILPVKDMQSEMSSGISYYEGEVYNVIRQGRGIPAVPLVVIGIAP